MLETVAIRKVYPGTIALDDVSLRFEPGKVCALLGKNGAGKSTLVKILAGTTQPNSGQILVDGKPAAFHSAADAFHHGIATVYQELSLIPGLTVAENILLGRMPRRGWMIDWKAARTRAQKLLLDMGVDLDVNLRIDQLGVAQQQIVEIAKAMSQSPKVLLLDEPTSSLARHETEMLFAIIRRLAANGVAIIHITHRLHEISRIADTVTVLRDGRHVGTVPMKNTAPQEIVRMIFGDVVQQQRPTQLAADAAPRLQVLGIHQYNKLHDISFTLKRGEILGIAGMVGSGRTELLRALFGADPIDGGQILLEGIAPPRHTVRAMKRLGAALIPENRKEQSLILPLSIRRNLCLASLKTVGTWGAITNRREEKITRAYVDQLAIKAADTSAPIASLSGGNQQKVVVGKWLNTHPRVIFFDEPTRGIDLHAKQQIFQIIGNLSREGISSIFVSSEFEELVEVCHRILIMKAGRIVDEIDAAQISVEQLVLRCMAEEPNAANSQIAGAA